MGISVTGQGTRVLARLNGTLAVTNTLTETTLFSYTVRGVRGPHDGILGTDRMLRLTLLADYLNNTGLPLASPHLIRVKFGGTTLLTDTSPLFAALVDWRPLVFQAWVANMGDTGAQMAWSTNATGGTLPGNNGASAAIDTTADRLLEVTVQHGVANALISFRRQSVTLELI